MGVGVTHHISRSSVCIRARDVPSLGARVQVIVDMPPTSANTRPGRLMGEGVAVRLVRAFGQPTAFAAKVRFRSKWAYPPAPVETAAPWREDAKSSTIQHEERLIGPAAQERRRPVFMPLISMKKMDILDINVVSEISGDNAVLGRSDFVRKARHTESTVAVHITRLHQS